MKSTSYLVRRPFRANGRDYATGDIFDASAAVHLAKLIDQRYLSEEPVEAPEPTFVMSGTGFVGEPPPPAPKRGRGRPKKNQSESKAS